MTKSEYFFSLMTIMGLVYRHLWMFGVKIKKNILGGMFFIY